MRGFSFIPPRAFVVDSNVLTLFPQTYPQAMSSDRRKREDRLFTLKDVIAVLPASLIGCGG